LIALRITESSGLKKIQQSATIYPGNGEIIIQTSLGVALMRLGSSTKIKYGSVPEIIKGVIVIGTVH